jgi:hypothetical protein
VFWLRTERYCFTLDSHEVVRWRHCYTSSHYHHTSSPETFTPSPHLYALCPKPYTSSPHRRTSIPYRYMPVLKPYTLFHTITRPAHNITHSVLTAVCPVHSANLQPPLYVHHTPMSLQKHYTFSSHRYTSSPFRYTCSYRYTSTIQQCNSLQKHYTFSSHRYTSSPFRYNCSYRYTSTIHQFTSL